MITPGLLTNLCRTELADSISVPETQSSERQQEGLQLGGKVEEACGGQLCVHSYLMELFFLLKVMTQPYWGFHSAFRCS